MRSPRRARPTSSTSRAPAPRTKTCASRGWRPRAGGAAAPRRATVLYVEGTGTEDEDLREAGLERARGLVASSDSDADNLYITLSARSVRPNLLIVARASDEDAAKKLRLAGADRVV